MFLHFALQVVSREESRHSFAIRLAYSDCPNGAADAIMSAERCTVQDPHRVRQLCLFSRLRVVSTPMTKWLCPVCLFNRLCKNLECCDLSPLKLLIDKMIIRMHYKIS